MSATIKPKVKPMTADPLGVTAKLIATVVAEHGAGSAGETFRQMLPAVLVVQAINRLTEAVQENTAAVQRNHIITTIAGRMCSDGSVELNPEDH